MFSQWLAIIISFYTFSNFSPNYSSYFSLFPLLFFLYLLILFLLLFLLFLSHLLLIANILYRLLLFYFLSPPPSSGNASVSPSSLCCSPHLRQEYRRQPQVTSSNLQEGKFMRARSRQVMWGLKNRASMTLDSHERVWLACRRVKLGWIGRVGEKCELRLFSVMSVLSFYRLYF